ncbi:MAG: shikimate dehydrogenase [Crocosphaera sp.]
MNEPATVTYPIAEVLTRIEDKLEKLNTIEVKLATIETEVKNLKEDVRDMKTVQNILVKEVSDLKGFRSLILPLIVGGLSAVIGGIVTALVRWLFITPNP